MAKNIKILLYGNMHPAGTALLEKRFAGAGPNVHEVEAVTKDNPLLKLDNFVGTRRLVCPK